MNIKFRIAICLKFFAVGFFIKIFRTNYKHSVKNMKKSILAILSIAALSAAANAEKSDRGDLSGVNAADIRAQKPAAVAPAPEATAPAVVVADKPACGKSCPAAQKAASKSYLTQFGKSWAAIGGGVNIYKIDGRQKLGANGALELSINALSFDDDKYGLNVLVPLSFDYISVDSESDVYRFAFPLNLRPYYRFDVCEDVVITPFGDFAAGGSYAYVSSYGAAKNLAFLWSLGAGVEISFCEVFSFTPKYTWLNEEDAGSSYCQIASAEFAWKFADNMVAVAEYGYSFFREASARDHAVVVKLRYEF